jgi:hypothetical protein
MPESKLFDPGQQMQINNAMNLQHSDIPQYFLCISRCVFLFLKYLMQVDLKLG